MLDVLLIILLVVVLSFAYVVAFGAPYVPTLNKQVATAFDLLDLKPGQHLLELGCGDGKVLVAAAERGIRCTGYELNPILYLICKIRTWQYRKIVSVKLANFWRVDWPRADAIFGFILPKLMSKLDEKIVNEKRTPIKVISFAFAIPGRDVTAEREGVLLYEYN